MRWRWITGSVVVTVGAVLTLLLGQLPAGAIDVSGTPSPVTGYATWFTGLGSPYGGCGLPQADLDSQNFLALNVQNSPGDYTNLPRPIPAADASEIGMFDNGLNCDRWVQVTIGDNCDGTNSGAPNTAFCTPGTLEADQFNGATLDMVVGDSCDDGNAWCKDNPYHVDLAQASLNQFIQNGQPVGDMYPNSWNNRQVTWQFIAAPNYTGNINIGAIQGAQTYWPAIAISHLPNGIHGVNYYANGSWVAATMDSDQGDDYIIGPTTGAGTPGTQYEIQVVDSSGNLVNNGEVYNFTLPSGCTNGCSPAYTPITYTTSTAPVTSPSPSPSPTTTSPSPSPSPSPTTIVPVPVALAHLNLRRRRLLADLFRDGLVGWRVPAPAHRDGHGHRAADRVDDRLRVRRHQRNDLELLERRGHAERAEGEREQRVVQRLDLGRQYDDVRHDSQRLQLRAVRPHV